jgi:hypothetical protein
VGLNLSPKSLGLFEDVPQTRLNFVLDFYLVVNVIVVELKWMFSA